MNDLSTRPVLRLVSAVHGFYYLLTGLWPIVHLASFEAVSGEKASDWLVRTVGAIVLVIGIVLLAAARNRRFTPEIILLGAGSAIAFAIVDVVYTFSGVIPAIYLLDAIAEVILATAWGLEYLFGVRRVA